VVSSVIAQHLKRPDVVLPDTAPGGAAKVNGRLIGVRGLQVWAEEPTEE
jgi:hypothetical protein